MRGISKSFGGVRANADVDSVLAPGEILGLLGENGAGKTTLMNILFGVYQRRCRHHRRRGQAGAHPVSRPMRSPPASAWCTSISTSRRGFPCSTICWSALPGKSGRLDRAGGLARPEAHRAAIRPGARSRPAGLVAVGRRAAAAGDHQGAVPRRAHPDPRRADRGADAGRGRRPVRGAAGHGRARASASSSSRTSSTRCAR